jgi:O-methyltransferase
LAKQREVVRPGGFVIIDDYKALEPCEAAVRDFRQAQSIDASIEVIDSLAVFWRKP